MEWAAGGGIGAVGASRPRRRPWGELTLILVAGTLGFCFDTVLSAAGLVISRGHRFPYPLNQPWMVALRLNIAATLNVSLEWLKGRCLLAAGCGIMTPFLVWLAKRFQRKGAAVIAF